MSENNEKNENRYSQTHSRIKRIRYIILTLLVLFVVFALFAYREDLTLENLRYLMKYVDVKPMTFGSKDNTQVNFEPDSATVTASFKEDLVVLTKTSLKIYDLSGKEILDSPHAMNNPAIALGDRYFAVYDVGAKYLAIYNSFSKLWEKSFEYPIYDVKIDEKGNFCVITSEKDRTSALEAYDTGFEKIFNWKSADKYSLCSDIYYDENIYFAIGTLKNTPTGDMLSGLLLLSNKNTEQIINESFSSELIMNVAFNSEGNLVCLTDRALRFYSIEGDLLNEKYFVNDSLRRFDVGDEWTVLVLNENLVGKEHKMIIFDAKGDTYMEELLDSELTDLCISEDFAFLLGVEDINVVALDTKTVKTYDSDRSYRAVELLDDENVYLIYDGLAVAQGVEMG